MFYAAGNAEVRNKKMKKKHIFVTLFGLGGKKRSAAEGSQKKAASLYY